MGLRSHLPRTMRSLFFAKGPSHAKDGFYTVYPAILVSMIIARSIIYASHGITPAGYYLEPTDVNVPKPIKFE